MSIKTHLSYLLVLCCVISVRAQDVIDSVAVHQELQAAYNVFLASPDSTIRAVNRTLEPLGSSHHFLRGYGYYVLSKAYWAKASFRLSIEYGFKALRIVDRDPAYAEWKVKTLLGLARVFIDLKNTEQGRRFIYQARVVAQRSKRDILMAEVYREQSMLCLEEGQYDSALLLADYGIRIYEQSHDTLNISILFSRQARVYFLREDYNRSLMLTRQALHLDSLVGNKRALGVTLLLVGANEYKLGHRHQAMTFLRQSHIISEEISNLSNLVRVHSLMADIYWDDGRKDDAIHELKLVNQYKDSLYNTERNGQIQEMQSLYELDTKNQTIRSLEEENAVRDEEVKNQRILLGLFAIGILLLIALILVLIRLRSTQQKANAALSLKNYAIEQQKEEIHTQAENLQQLNELKTKLFSVISHDLRGPVASLRALLELLTGKHLQADEFVLLSEKLKVNVDVTQRTLENLLNWSLSQMEGIRTDRKPLSVKAVADECCRLLEETARRKGVTLTNHLLPEHHILADANQVSLMLRNVIHNAIKFSHPQGIIELRAMTEGNTCHVVIRDYGIGMSAEELSLLTTSTTHFSKTGTQQEKGTGLGLLLCHEFIKRNLGSLQVHSTPGAGTTVTLSFPQPG